MRHTTQPGPGVRFHDIGDPSAQGRVVSVDYEKDEVHIMWDADPYEGMPKPHPGVWPIEEWRRRVTVDR